MHGHPRPRRRWWRWLGLSVGLLVCWQHHVAWAIFLDHTVQYNYLDGPFNGIGVLRDRDNVILQLEVVS